MINDLIKYGRFYELEIGMAFDQFEGLEILEKLENADHPCFICDYHGYYLTVGLKNGEIDYFVVRPPTKIEDININIDNINTFLISSKGIPDWEIKTGVFNSIMLRYTTLSNILVRVVYEYSENKHGFSYIDVGKI